LTLVELLVVLGVLIVVSVILVPLLGNLTISSGNTRKSPQQIATETTFQHVRDAIMGTPSQPGLWNDLGENEAYPQYIADLFICPSTLPANLQAFDPNTRLGWRGPYLQWTGALYGKSNGDPAYENPDYPAVLDGWGRPIILQYPVVSGSDCSNYVRLVSAGPDGKFDTSPNEILPSRVSCGDDVILYLRVPDTRP